MKKILYVVLCLSLFACSKPNDSDDGDGVKHQRAGSFVLPENRYYDFLNDTRTSILDSADIELEYAAPIGITLGAPQNHSAYNEIGGVQRAHGNMAPYTNYLNSVSATVDSNNTPPLYFWVLCRDNLHYCRLTIDSLELNTAYISYIINLDANDTEF